MKKHVETPETMIRFLQIVTGRTAMVKIEGPSEAEVEITRKTAQKLFKEAAHAGYKTQLRWCEGRPVVLLRVINL